MKKCRLTIATSGDGTETSTARKGEMELLPLGATLCYEEENAVVTLKAEKGRVEILRNGDYSMRLAFEEGKTLVGSLGIGGNEGELQTKTHRLAFSVNKDSFLLSLHYALVFGEEKQEMKIRLSAREV